MFLYLHMNYITVVIDIIMAVVYNIYIYIYIYIRGSLNKFPDFFRVGNYIDSTHMKL